MFSIELNRSNRRILVPITLLPPDTGVIVQGIAGHALLDTGATTSGIKTSVAGRLGLSATGKRPLLSAHGEAHAHRYIFRIALAPDAAPDEPPRFPYVFPETDGFELKDSFSYDAILGMDILSRCDLTLNRNGTGRLAFG